MEEEKHNGQKGASRRDISRRKSTLFSPYETRLPQSLSKARPKYEAWLSSETTITEINVNEHYFVIEGFLTVFWKDEHFDENGELQKLIPYNQYSNELLDYLLSQPIYKQGIHYVITRLI